MIVRYARRKNLITRWYDGEAFVITPKAIENLPALSAQIWRWLTIPRTEEDICQRVHLMYPGVDQSRITEDIQNLLTHLKAKALVVSINAPAARKAIHRRSTGR